MLNIPVRAETVTGTVMFLHDFAAAWLVSSARLATARLRMAGIVRTGQADGLWQWTIQQKLCNWKV